MLALDRENLKTPVSQKDTYISYAAPKREEAIRIAGERRAAGEIVELSPSEETKDEAVRRQKAKGYRELVYIE